MIRVSTLAAAALCLSAAASSLPARADVSIGVRNGDRVIGTLSPADAEETLRVDVPKGAKLIVTVVGKKLRGAGPAPSMNFDVFGPTEGLLGTGVPRRKGARLAITATPSSGEYRVVFYQRSGLGVGCILLGIVLLRLRGPRPGEPDTAKPGRGA